ncbi:lysostaphin resistance A-like protein [Algibacter sp. R77976]|uniref:lysostaphin resistance A-like protein n=1 Tax=Algibacter sp. R77976 TaxID=3093873 RepID=UPI0037C55767
MKRKTKYIPSLLIPYSVFFVLLGIPLSKSLKNNQNSLLVVSMLIAIVLLILLFITFAWLIKKNDLLEFNGIKNGIKFINPKLLLIPLIYFIYIIIRDFNIYSNLKILELILLAMSSLLIGLAEEFFFRGILFPYFISFFKRKKYSLFFSVLLSSIVFGLFHYLNLFQSSVSFIEITLQVVYAFFTGILFCALLLRTKSIIIPSLIHALIDFRGLTYVLYRNKTTIIPKSLDKKLPDGIFWEILI